VAPAEALGQRLSDEAVPPERQETPDPAPRPALVSEELDFEAIIEELKRSPGFVEALDPPKGQDAPTGPRITIETTVATSGASGWCSTGQPGAEEPERPVMTGDLVGRDRSSVPLMARLSALPEHETGLDVKRVDGPERPVPFHD